MQSAVPIATDHIYKFYALFGLYLLISSWLTLAYLHVYYSNLIYKEFVDLKILEAKAKADQSHEEKIRIENLEFKIRLDRSIHLLLPKILGSISGLAVVLIIYGFIAWHIKIQPKHDRLLDLQIEKIKCEIRTLNR